MRPASYDDVLLAYQMGLRDLHRKQDHLRAAADEVVRLQSEVEAQGKLVRELRSELLTYGEEVAA